MVLNPPNADPHYAKDARNVDQMQFILIISKASAFKTDLGIEFDRFETIGELVEAIHQQINYHNNTLIHTTLKMSPVQFRNKYYQTHPSECQLSKDISTKIAWEKSC